MHDCDAIQSRGMEWIMMDGLEREKHPMPCHVTSRLMPRNDIEKTVYQNKTFTMTMCG